ncbi:MAG: sodium:proton antiporter NhaD [Bacteroidales bacterium]|nr:sodium:proton antiporter NhaD [Bacteroidales bacterium]
MVTIIVTVFILGYLCIALESVLKVNKAAPALLMCVACWVLYMLDAGSFIESFRGVSVAAGELSQWVNEHILLSHLGDTCEILFFLMGAMTIVEIVDANGGFNFVRDRLQTTNKHALLWRITFMTFFLSAVLDNLTTSIVMIMVLRKLVQEPKDRLIYASLIILAANAGGAFSPIGDVTTIMLWIKGNITTVGVIKELLIPSIVSVVVPTFLLQFKLKGELSKPQAAEVGDSLQFSKAERTTVFCLGVGGLIFVPIFRFLTGLPPFMGILLVLGLLWTTTEIFYRSKGHIEETTQQRVTQLLTRIDMSTILFFLGILMAVATLQETGVLTSFGRSLDTLSGGNHYLVTGIIGVVSSIVDNVPLVAGCMGMYDVAATGDFAVDGIFWQLLAYCAGVGGSMLIIGSAAGVVVMGLEKITFGWYLRHFSWIAFVGYLAGMGAYWVEKALGL